MRRLIRMSLIVAISLSLLPGCWDIREIQEINYITALGIDFRDGEYMVYAQMLDFSSVAKQESGKATEQIPIWVGRGTGRTLSEAITDIYTTNQQQLSWGHVTALVLTEPVLTAERMNQVFDLTNRSQEIRYTKWIYGTQNRLEELFTTTPFFQLSPLHSLLHEPQESFKQLSFVRPIQFNQFIIRYREKGATVVLPSIHISSANWSENMRQHPLMELSGAFFIQGQKNKGWMSREDISGIRWLASRSTRATIEIKQEGESVGSILFEAPQPAIEVIRRNDVVTYRVKLNVNAMVQHMHRKISLEEMNKLAKQALSDEIVQTFQKASRKNIDPYQLSLHLYRKNPELWKKLNAEGKDVTDESLQDVEVSIRLRFWGQRKNMEN